MEEKKGDKESSSPGSSSQSSNKINVDCSEPVFKTMSPFLGKPNECCNSFMKDKHHWKKNISSTIPQQPNDSSDNMPLDFSMKRPQQSIPYEDRSFQAAAAIVAGTNEVRCPDILRAGTFRPIINGCVGRSVANGVHLGLKFPSILPMNYHYMQDLMYPQLLRQVNYSPRSQISSVVMNQAQQLGHSSQFNPEVEIMDYVIDRERRCREYTEAEMAKKAAEQARKIKSATKITNGATSPNLVSLGSLSPKEDNDTTIVSTSAQATVSTSEIHQSPPSTKRSRGVPEEEKDDAYREKRRKNNQAAKKSRDARRAKEETLIHHCKFLEKENEAKELELRHCKKEIEQLKLQLNNIYIQLS